MLSTRQCKVSRRVGRLATYPWSTEHGTSEDCLRSSLHNLAAFENAEYETLIPINRRLAQLVRTTLNSNVMYNEFKKVHNSTLCVAFK